MKKGYVTVFFSIAISLCLSLLVGLIYGARENAIRMRAREAVEISMRSAFGEYQKELWEHYNLVFVDASYGSSTYTMILPEEHMKQCLNHNFDENGLALLGGKDLLKLSVADIYTDKVRFATDDKGAAVKNQAVTCMKYRVGTGYLEQLYQSIIPGSEYSFSDDELENISNAAEETEELNVPIFNEKKDDIKKLILGKKNVSMLSTLRLVLDNVSEVSSVKINKNALLEKRSQNKGNFGQNKSGMADDLFFSEYIVTYFGNFLDVKSHSILKYETEYIIAGHYSDAENLEAVANRVLLIRQAANMSSLQSDKRRMAEIRIIAEIASAILMNPELEAAIETTAVTVWSFVESIDDAKRLLSGQKVPLLKKSGEWRTSLKSLLNPFDDKVEYKTGLTYADYLRLFLLLSKDETLSKRMMNIIEIDIRNISGNDNFRLDFCFDAWGITAFVESEYGYSYSVKREYDLERR